MERITNMKALFIIVNAGFTADIVDIARAEGATGATILNARGEGSRHEVFMGITVDSEKEVVLCLVNEQTADKIMASIKSKAGITTETHALCFTLPIDQVVGINTSFSQYQQQDQ